MKRILVCVIIILLALFLAGCEEDVADVGSGEEGSAESSAEKESKSSVGTKFVDIIKKKMDLEYTVEYKITSNAPGTESYTMKQYFGGADKFRVDMKMDEGETRTYLVGDTVYSCNDMQGDWQCLKMSGMERDMDATAQFKSVEDNPDAYDINYEGTKKVAGTTALCYAIGVPGTGEMQYCFSKEGVPLYMLIDAEGSRVEMAATNYKTSVSSSDFEPPAEAQDMAALMEQAMGDMPEGYEMPDY
jgi:hypothetical protein